MVLVKDRAMAELLGPGATQREIGVWGGWALGITLVGWSVGGLLFGMVADRWGRTRTMALTILIYSVFTGLTGLAQTPTQLLVLRFIAALGIGGEWGAGASMIAEVFPKASRALAAGILQSAAGTGFFAAILLEYLVGGNWRYAFFGGALPAFLALVVRLGLREPEVWVAAKEKAATAQADARQRTSAAAAGSLAAVFASRSCAVVCCSRRRWRSSASSPTGARTSGSTRGSPSCCARRASSQARSRAACAAALIVLNIGNMAGFLSFIPLTNRLGRRAAFAVFHVGALVAMPVAYLFSSDYTTGAGAVLLRGAVHQRHLQRLHHLFPRALPHARPRDRRQLLLQRRPHRRRARPGDDGMADGRARASSVPAGQTVAYAGAIMGCFYVLAFAVIPFLPETRGVDLDRD